MFVYWDGCKQGESLCNSFEFSLSIPIIVFFYEGDDFRVTLSALFVSFIFFPKWRYCIYYLLSLKGESIVEVEFLFNNTPSSLSEK